MSATLYSGLLQMVYTAGKGIFHIPMELIDVELLSLRKARMERKMKPLILILTIFSAVALADEETAAKIIQPKLLKREVPDKNLSYSRCVAFYKTDKKSAFVTGVETTVSSMCPIPTSIKFDIAKEAGGKESITSDDGKTVATIQKIDKKTMSETFDFDGKPFRFAFSPYEIKINPKEDGSADDKFFAVVALSEPSNETMLLVSTDCSNIANAFRTRLPLDPIRIDDKGESNAHGVKKGTH